MSLKGEEETQSIDGRGGVTATAQQQGTARKKSASLAPYMGLFPLSIHLFSLSLFLVGKEKKRAAREVRFLLHLHVFFLLCVSRIRRVLSGRQSVCEAEICREEGYVGRLCKEC